MSNGDICIKQQIQFHKNAQMWESENQLVSIFWSSFLLSKGELAAWPWHVCIQLNIQTAVSRCTWQNRVKNQVMWVFFLSPSSSSSTSFRFSVPHAESVGLVHLVWSARDGVQFSSMQCSWAAMVRLIHPCVSMRGAVVPLLCALSAIAALPVLTPLNSARSFDLSYGYYH